MNTAILTYLFITTSAQFNLPHNLLNSVCFVESRHNVMAFHKNDGVGNSVGLCQIKYKTSKWLGFKGTEKQLMDPETNIYYAAKYLKYQLKRYKSVTRALVAYNIGNAKHLQHTSYSARVEKQWRSMNVRSSYTARN